MSSLGAGPCLWAYIAGSTAWLLLTAQNDATSKDKSIDDSFLYSRSKLVNPYVCE